MNFSNLKFLITLLIIHFAVSADLLLGSRCRDKYNSTGICVKINDCKSIMDQVRAGTIRSNPPAICSQGDRTVCCPIPEASTTTTERVTNVEREMRISEKKCFEYGRKLVNIRKITPILGEESIEIIDNKCKHKSTPLIVGGEAALPFEFPHQALLGYTRGNQNEWNCGGSLISENFVLTAAHCLYPRHFGAVKFVKLGISNRSDQHSNVLLYDVDEIIQHPNFSLATRNADIGLLKLKGVVPIDEFVLPICLPIKQHDDFKAVVTGFGTTGYMESVSENLLKITIEKFAFDECKEAFDGRVAIRNDTMLCYGHHTEMKDSCGGDSGGPLQINNDHQVKCTYTQIGIVSFGPTYCGSQGVPGVYVNVYHFIDWIENIVWKNEK